MTVATGAGVDRLCGQELHAHVTLERGERSALANLANQHL
jgi:predicted ribonuclease YlaK